MCTTTISTLTLAALLRDPLIQLVMQSDKVSESDHSALLHRVKDSLVARGRAPVRELELELELAD